MVFNFFWFCLPLSVIEKHDFWDYNNSINFKHQELENHKCKVYQPGIIRKLIEYFLKNFLWTQCLLSPFSRYCCSKLGRYYVLCIITGSKMVKIDWLLSFDILIETPSYPLALLYLKFVFFFKCLSLMKLTQLILSSVWYLYEEATVLSFEMGLHYCLKNSLKILAFSEKLIKSLSSASKGEIIRTFLPLKNILRI